GTFAGGRDLIGGLANGEFGADDFNTHYFSLAGDNIDDRITGGSVAGELFVGELGIDRLKFGVTRTDRRKARDLINNAITGGADYYSGDNAINVGDLGGSVLSRTFNLPNFMDGVSSVFPRSLLSLDVPGYIAALSAYDGHQIGRASCRSFIHT